MIDYNTDTFVGKLSLEHMNDEVHPIRRFGSDQRCLYLS